MAVFQVRNGIGHGQRPRSAGMPSLSCTRKTKHANTSNLYSHLKKAVRPKRNDKRKGKASSSTTRECTIEEFLSLPLSSGSREHKELTISSACLILETTCQYLVIS